MWHRIHQLAEQNPHFQNQVATLKAAVVCSRAKGTMHIYRSWFSRFKIFCEKCGVQVQNASVAEMAIFLQAMADDGYAGTTMAQAA